MITLEQVRAYRAQKAPATTPAITLESVRAYRAQKAKQAPQQPNLARGYQQPPAADATALGPGYDQYRNINDTRLIPGLTQAVVPPIPRRPVEGNALQQAQAVASNAALGVRDLVGMPLQMIEDPVGVIPGMVKMTGEALKTVHGLMPPTMGGSLDPRVSAEARRTAGEQPLETAMGLALPFGIGKGLVKGRTARPQITPQITPETTPRTSLTGLEPVAETAKTVTAAEKPLPAEVAPEIQRPVSPPLPKTNMRWTWLVTNMCITIPLPAILSRFARRG